MWFYDFPLTLGPSSKSVHPLAAVWVCSRNMTILNQPGQELFHTLPPLMYVALLPCSGVGLGPYELLPGLPRMWRANGSMLNAFVLISVVCSVYRGLVSCTVCLAPLVTNSPFSFVSSPSSYPPLSPNTYTHTQEMLCFDTEFLRQYCLEMCKDVIRLVNDHPTQMTCTIYAHLLNV